MKVLYVNHTSRMSGAEHSLIALLRALPQGVEPLVACPEGHLAAAVRDIGVPVVTVPGTDGSLKLHPVHTARAVFEMGGEAAAVRWHASRFGADLVHANSIRAGVATCLGPASATPTLVHIRDCLPTSFAASLSLRAITRGATLVLANSRYTEACFARQGGEVATGVLYSPVDLERFDPALLTREEARARLELDAEAPVVAVLAQLTPWKGQDDAVRLVVKLREDFPGIRLLLVGTAKFISGATRFDNVAYTDHLRALVEALGVSEQVEFMGERTDVPEILRALDLLLVPSWEEPFGRTVVEAMAMEVPVLATAVGGPAESIRHGVDGLLVPPRWPERWVEPATTLLEDPERRAEMGANGRRRAIENFSSEVLSQELMRRYEEVLSSR